MTRRMVLLVLAALCFHINSTPAVAQSSATSKLGSINGRVLADGQPVTNASVSVSSVNPPRQSRTVPTNDNGDFEVKGLERGIYRVQVNAPAYVTPPADLDQQLHPVGESVTVNMIKGAVVTGKVVTADNDPVVAVRVRAMMVRDANGRRPTVVVDSNDRLTDDRGIYRIFGLLPGIYVVYAGGRGFSGTGANAYDNDAPTFAPSSTRDTAEQISLASGDERTVDIRYRGIAGHAVSGNVTAPTSASSPFISVNLARIVDSTLDVRISTYQRAGAKGFDFHGVADGDYLVWSEYAAGTGEALTSEPKRITVKGADVTGIELVVKPLASVAGAVLLERATVPECRGKLRPLFEETVISLQRNQRQRSKAEPARDEQVELPARGPAQASPDSAGSFDMRNLAAGQYSFNVRTFAKSWYLRSITVPGPKDSLTNDLARSLLILKSGDRVTGLKVVLAEGAASISGQVDLPEDRRAKAIVFYVVPAEKDKVDEVLRYVSVPVADDGSFTMDGVPPGRYWTIAKPVRAEDALRLATPSAARIKLRREAEAAKSELELKPCQNLSGHKPALDLN